MKFFSFIYPGEIHEAEDKKIIPQEQFSSLMDAHAILEKAKEEAEKYKSQIQQECEELKKEAKEEGFNEGLTQFNEHILHFEQELKKVRHEMNKMILPLALKAAKKIVAKELEQHPETIVDIVLQALAPVTQSRHITIYVNKADKEILESNKPRIRQILEQVETLSVKERSDVQPGGCIVETESGIINASIENQWRALEAAFDRYMKK